MFFFLLKNDDAVSVNPSVRLSVISQNYANHAVIMSINYINFNFHCHSNFYSLPRKISKTAINSIIGFTESFLHYY